MSEANVIELEHVYSHPPAAVWRALTDPETHARWWGAGDVRPVLGHQFQLDMGRWGMQDCEVLAVEPERLFRYRFAIGVLDTTITWTLEPEKDGTRLQLRHEGFDVNTLLGREALRGMGEGWPNVMRHLDEVIDEDLARC